MALIQSRRRFIAGLTIAGASGFVGTTHARAGEGALETTAVRLVKNPGICTAPQYIAEELLRTEGFTDIRYIDTGPPEITATVARGRADFSMNYAAQLIRNIDTGEAVTVLGGVHVGCTELFARPEIRTITDLKGKSVGVQALGSLPNVPNGA